MVTLKLETETGGANSTLDQKNSGGSKIDLSLSPEDFYRLCLEMDKAKQQLELISQKVK